MNDPETTQRLLAAYFSPEEVEWKPQATSKDGRKAMACAYIDARCVMDRLDQAVGAAGWQDAYTVLEDGNVVCRLSLRIGDEWVTKEDVGAVSDQKDVGDKRKAAFSDALKRAAVKFGVGRYLYSLPSQWVDYDPDRKQFSRTPALPSWALPNGTPPVKPAPAPAPAKGNGPPANGQELLDRLGVWGKKLAAAKVTSTAEIVEHLKVCLGADWGEDLENWGAEAAKEAAKVAKVFVEAREAEIAARKAK